jgi:hypothetical protein
MKVTLGICPITIGVPLELVDATGCQKGHLKANPLHSGQKGLTFFMACNSPLDIFGCYTFNER